MNATVDKARADLDRLVKKGRTLLLAMRLSVYPTEIKAALLRQMKDNAGPYIKTLPSFDAEYQRWYGEAAAVVAQLTPDRLAEFSRHHERPKARREVTAESYSIEDYLQGLQFPRANPKDKPLGREAAIPHFQQQVAILDAAGARLDSALFDLRQALQAELLAAELDAATQLAALGAGRAAGTLAGVVLERHLAQVCRTHRLWPGAALAGPAQAPPGTGMPEWVDALRAAAVLDGQQAQLLHHLAELRALCDRSRTPEPSAPQVEDLLAGVRRVIKTVF